MKKFGAIIIALCFSTAAIAVDKTTATPAKPATPAPQQATLSPNANAVTKALFGKGIVTCGNQVEKITDYLALGGSSGVATFVAPVEPNRNMVSTSMEVIDKEKNLAYTTESFAPNSAGGCSSVYDAVKYWPKKCDEVISSQFPKDTKPAVLHQNIKVVKLAQNTKVFLMPAGDGGCVSIKKEVSF